MTRIGFAEFLWMWNQCQGMTTPALHRRMARWLNHRWRRGDHQLLLMAFRSSGKSTLVGLFCAWVLAQNPDLRILVLAADQALAVKMVRNVKRILERHPLTGELKPRDKDQWAADRFTVERPTELRDPSMLARGISANITGSRADIVICDDVEVPNTCDTPAKRTELRDKLSELDYVLTPGGTQLFVGTPHSFYTIYAAATRKEAGEERSFLDGFHRLELPLLDGRGRSRWPERYDMEAVRALRLRHGPNKFSSQMLLQPVNYQGGRLDPDLLCPYDAKFEYREAQGEAILSCQGRRVVSATAWWDPAFAAGQGGDRSVLACVFVDEDGRYLLHDILYLTAEVNGAEDAARQQCRQVARFLKRHLLPAVTVEINGIGRFLPSLLRTILGEEGVAAAVIEVASTRPKDLRILEAFDSVLAARSLHIHARVAASPFLIEFREWRPGVSGASDDGLDAVAGCLAAEPIRLPRRTQSGLRPRWRGAATTIHADTDFTP